MAVELNARRAPALIETERLRLHLDPGPAGPSPTRWTWRAEERASGDPVGWFTLQGAPAGDEARASWFLDHAYWCKGLANQGMQAIIDVAFGRLGYRTVTSSVEQGNRGAERLVQQLGMRRAAERPPDPSSAAQIYAIDRGEPEPGYSS